MGVGGPDEEKKLNCLLALQTDVTVITDSHTDHNKLDTLKSKYRTSLNGYHMFGHDSVKRGVTVMIKKSSGCLMENYVELDSTDTLAFDVVCPDTTVIHIIACYAPSHRDDPVYWSAVYDNYMENDSEYKMILGDYNVTPY